MGRLRVALVAFNAAGSSQPLCVAPLRAGDYSHARRSGMQFMVMASRVR